MDELRRMELEVEAHIKAGDKEASVAGLYELIVAYAKQKDFTKAEEFRDRLYEVDPMALGEIVKSGEIIEQGKSESRDSTHVKVWAGLYDVLTPEETNALYYSLKNRRFAMDEVVFSEGDKNWNLFLIDQGEVKMTYGKGSREVLLKTLGPGEIFGEETFFSRTAFCTASAVTLTSVQANLLEGSALKKWENAFPGLEGKLRDFAFSHRSRTKANEAKHINRRVQRRVNMEGTLLVQIVDPKGKAAGKPFKGSFLDISSGGLAFLIRVSKPDTARLLLGRRLVVKFNLPLRNGLRELQRSGRIIAVQPHIFNDHSIHVRFAEALPEQLIDLIVEAPKAEGPQFELELED